MTKNEITNQNQRENVNKGASKQIDGGWGWIVVLGSFGINFVCMSSICTLGIIFPLLLSEFNEGKGYTSWIVSLLKAVSSISSILSSYLVNLYGPRTVVTIGSIISAVCISVSYFAQNVTTLIVAVGIGGGLGLGLAYLPAIVSVNAYFDKYRSIAVGIAVSGAGCGTFIVAPIATYLSQELGWRWTMVVLSGACLFMTVLGSTFRPLMLPKEEKIEHELKEDQHHESPEDNHRELLSFGLLKDPIFMLFAVSTLLTYSGFFVPFFCLADRSIQHGLTHYEASQMVSILGTSNTLGRIFWGYVSDRPWLNRFWVFNICLVFAGLANVASVVCSDYPTLAVYSALFGFIIGSAVTMRSVILTDLLGLAKLNNSLGLLLVFEAVGALAAGPSAGFLHDQFGSYSYGFVFSGCMLMLSGFVLFFMPMVRRNVAKKKLERKLSV